MNTKKRFFGATGQSIAHVNDRNDEKGKWVLWIIIIWCRELNRAKENEA
jgi:hypothetical protein